jgi:protein-arginine kinase activator protein McsA
VVESRPEESDPGNELGKMNLEELKQLLKKVLEKEDYMRAVAIRDEIQKRSAS